MSSFSAAELDELLANADTLANVDETVGILRILGLEPRPEVIRRQAALYKVEPERTELLVALIGRRLSSLEGAL